MGVGAMTDFGPLLANPRTLFLGAAAQFGIFATLLGAIALSSMGILDFDIKQAAAIGIIGGADGPTAIFVAGKLAPELLGAIAIAAYSYMALVPIIQPPIMRALTTEQERKIEMVQLREVSRLEKIVFPYCYSFLWRSFTFSGTITRNVLFWKSDERVWCGGSVDRHYPECLDQYRHHFFRARRRIEAQLRSFSEYRNPWDLVFGDGCVRDRNCQWGFNGKAHEYSQFYTNQSVDRSGWSLCSPYGIKSGE